MAKKRSMTAATTPSITRVRKRKSSPTHPENPAHQSKRSRPTNQPPPPTLKNLHPKQMAFFGLRKWPTPIVKPLWPFMFAGVTVMYLVGKAQDSGVKSAEWRNDPRNPYAAQLAKESLH